MRMGWSVGWLAIQRSDVDGESIDQAKVPSGSMPVIKLFHFYSSGKFYFVVHPYIQRRQLTESRESITSTII